MKKGLVFILSVFIVIAAVVQGCKRQPTPPEEPTPIDTLIPTPEGWLIDDMDKLANGMPGADNANAVPEDQDGPGYWYTYDDLNNEGDSVVWPMSENAFNKYNYPAPFPTFVMTAPGYGGKGYCARISGRVTTTFQYGFVGMGVNLLGVNEDQSKKPVNLTGKRGIWFLAKGDGKNYRIKLPSQHSGFVLKDGDNHYGRQFVAPASWTQVDILLSQLTQEPYWGNSVALADALTMIDSIQFQTVGQPHASIDLYVDNIVIYE